MADAALSLAHVRLAVGSLRGLARAEGRAVTRPEQGAITALLKLVEEPLTKPEQLAIKQAAQRRKSVQAIKAKAVRDRLPVGCSVTFKSTGRYGLSPTRSGTVAGYHESTRGIWIVVAEAGAAPGILVRAYASLVSAASTPAESKGL